ncbi:[Pyruvate dehydrogenase (acetyl-transferring)] kinase isozyme 4 [Pichia californica]|uniref:Protein-serine/threonine kinase n=1 Tax=Pichia californica TaxID=460514 RepID=A0A9P7BE67_9ASCO|nr:[Pyruvate dehydrogenase (acetyl-transferring)] kinase isozyme 4 [[Candida] californica]KAG0686780.1 [Pyruvate dehydrogenase (acetyl-transferring)] kinase isozyme 4 [[Candida] californica]
MFKLVSSIFKPTPAPIVPVTRELLQKRHHLCSNLGHIYKTQLDLLNNTLPNELLNEIPILKYYTEFSSQYLDQLKELNNTDFNNIEYTEEKFQSLITKQLDSKVLELEVLNSKIQPDDLKSLDDNYSNDIDSFFFHFHSNRIAASFELKEYLYEKPLLQVYNAKSVLDQAIKTTSRMLSLNDYPIPKFKPIETIDSNLKVYCISPHAVHIMFELFKNATLPSITKNQPIMINISIDKNDSNSIIFEIKDNGGGMPESMIEKIWQFHYTTTKANDRDPIHGFGMGLPLCKVFAEFNDGSLDLVNKPGEGVTIYFKVPKGIEKV